MNTKDREIVNASIFYRVYYLYMSLLMRRVKYYLAWVLADAVNNASGLGFNGYDDKGNPKWDLVTNVKIIQLEVPHFSKFIVPISTNIQ